MDQSMDALVVRDAGGRFKAGTIGNPGGRPAQLREVVDLARSHTEAAITRLAELIDSENEFVALSAIEAMLSRGWGKPLQAIATASIDATQNAAQIKFVLDQLESRGVTSFRRDAFIESETVIDAESADAKG
jgi:hypothetical protein